MQAIPTLEYRTSPSKPRIRARGSMNSCMHGTAIFWSYARRSLGNPSRFVYLFDLLINFRKQRHDESDLPVARVVTVCIVSEFPAALRAALPLGRRPRAVLRRLFQSFSIAIFSMLELPPPPSSQEMRGQRTCGCVVDNEKRTQEKSTSGCSGAWNGWRGRENESKGEWVNHIANEVQLGSECVGRPHDRQGRMRVAVNYDKGSMGRRMRREGTGKTTKVRGKAGCARERRRGTPRHACDGIGMGMGMSLVVGRRGRGNGWGNVPRAGAMREGRGGGSDRGHPEERSGCGGDADAGPRWEGRVDGKRGVGGDEEGQVARAKWDMQRGDGTVLVEVRGQPWREGYECRGHMDSPHRLHLLLRHAHDTPALPRPASPPTPPPSLDTALPGCATSCAGVHRFGCGRAGAAPTALLAWLLLLTPGGMGSARQPCATPPLMWPLLLPLADSGGRVGDVVVPRGGRGPSRRWSARGRR
ncbi:hypothetical protein DFH09DRAFT_1281724 [Mycena vulgaris]|nr:hypothetical protein DFH09DRAFT_1281724 [Mycena vulgaris]